GVNFENATSRYTLLYLHPVHVKRFDLSFDGTIYFSDVNNEIWSINPDGSNAQFIFSTTGDAGEIATDPHNTDTLVYVDGEDIKHRVISTGVTTDVIVGKMNTNKGMVVLNGVLYTNYHFKPGHGWYIRMNLDGTNVYEYNDPQSYLHSFGFVVDTVNKKAYTLSTPHYYLHDDPDIADLPPDPSVEHLLTVPRALGLNVSFDAVSNAVAYMLTLQRVGRRAVRTVAEGFTDLSVDVDSLKPETQYTVRLYTSTDGVEYTLYLETQATTAANAPENYSVSDFARGGAGEGYDVSDLNEDAATSLFGVINELFTTGDDVVVTLPGGSKKKTKFVKRGESASVADVEALLLPFDESAGASQSASLTLSDNSSVTLTFDEVNDTVDVGGIVCSPGDSVVIDGKKMTVTDV
ncbi:unnamed protein product, partial [Ectocarpus sp. 12 AP-2014]